MKLTNYELYHENKSHTSTEFPYNTYLCSIPLDFRSIKLHWHEEAEIIVIKKGEGIVSVDLTEYHVQTGDIIFVMSGQLHSITQFESSSMEYENIFFKPRLLKASGNDLCWDRFLSPLLTATFSVPVIFRADTPLYPTLAGQIQAIDTLCDKKPAGYQLAVKGHLFLMFYTLSSEGISYALPDRKRLDKIKTVISYVEEHYAQTITIEEMAALCYFSKSYFMKFFKESMGTSFVTYLNDYRLEAAAKLLRATDDNVLEIANACGFDNLSYFNRSFKKKHGITPGKYRTQRILC
ncbi:MAG: helix-turn-helix domain-containing protein [Lachnospiraceae bacterium]|nr:helix-turn-helix domain-containing protein [Lachnospiraceae bacterium]